MKIAHFVSKVGKLSFGMGPVILNLVHSQQQQGLNACIQSLSENEEPYKIENNYQLKSKTIQTFPITGPSHFGYSIAMRKANISNPKSFDLLHRHGLWTGVSLVTNNLRKAHGIPTVITPHGTLEAWALHHSKWKKRVALWLYEKEHLTHSSCLHALSLNEAQDFRKFGLRNPIAIIPNGISQTWLSSQGNETRFREKFDISHKTNILLFLGRITPKKGLPMLFRSMDDQRIHLREWKLVIAGVDEFGHQRELESLIDKYYLWDHIQFVGPLFDQNKRDAFAAANAFVLPSHSEGAPLTILEALGAGVPVLATKASPWEELITNNCGWWTEITESALTDALNSLLNTSRDSLREMGRRGKSLAEQKYSWLTISQKTISLYEWILGQTTQPDFVIEN